MVIVTRFEIFFGLAYKNRAFSSDLLHQNRSKALPFFCCFGWYSSVFKKKNRLILPFKKSDRKDSPCQTSNLQTLEHYPPSAPLHNLSPSFLITFLYLTQIETDDTDKKLR